MPFTIQQATWRDLQDLYRLEHTCFEEDAWPALVCWGVDLPGIVRLKAEWGGKMVGLLGAKRAIINKPVGLSPWGLEEYRRHGWQSPVAECEQQLATRSMRRVCA